MGGLLRPLLVYRGIFEEYGYDCTEVIKWLMNGIHYSTMVGSAIGGKRY